MATKKTRIDRRGKIRPLVKPFPPVGRLHWKKQKLLTILANRKQWTREFDPTVTSEIEIEMEHLAGYYLVTEASIPSSPTYIITE